MTERYWNHRVVKVKDGDEEYFQIREVYYNADDTIFACTERAVGVSSRSIYGLRETLEWMLKCLDKPVLIEEEIEFVDKDSYC